MGRKRRPDTISTIVFRLFIDRQCCVFQNVVTVDGFILRQSRPYLGDLNEVKDDLRSHVVVDALEDLGGDPVTDSIESIAEATAINEHSLTINMSTIGSRARGVCAGEARAIPEVGRGGLGMIGSEPGLVQELHVSHLQEELLLCQRQLAGDLRTR